MQRAHRLHDNKLIQRRARTRPHNKQRMQQLKLQKMPNGEKMKRRNADAREPNGERRMEDPFLVILPQIGDDYN